MPERSIRFGVRGIDGRQAATWKCWNSGSRNADVYLACRVLKGELKASLHQSGRWHVAFSPDFYESGFNDPATRPASRFAQSWPRPPDIAQGITLAFRIVVPWFSATVVDEAVAPDVFWATSAPTGQAVEFDVLICRPETVTAGWPGKNTMGTSPVGCFTLPNEDIIWIVHRLTPIAIPSPLRGNATLFTGVEAHAPSASGLRAIVFGSEADGSRVMYDVPVTVARDVDG